MKPIPTRTSRHTLLAGALLLSAAAWAAPDAPQLERRLQSVETLIERSSAARQIESSAVAAAVERREKARVAHRAATESLRRGELDRTAALLSEASANMVEGARLAAPERVVAGKDRGDFESRLESAKALLAAQRRIAAEKSTPSGRETSAAIERQVADAEAAARAGDLTAARASAERAYLLARAAIGSMRGGDTLVRTLTFASPEEEYAYELDRNDTHRMLLTMLLDGPKGEAAGPARTRSGELRTRAEAAARDRDYANALRLLEDSTRELVRAIRAAGVYIPG
jgi:hypothetical protein